MKQIKQIENKHSFKIRPKIIIVKKNLLSYYGFEIEMKGILDQFKK
jgi:hypothetical protein